MTGAEYMAARQQPTFENALRDMIDDYLDSRASTSEEIRRALEAALIRLREENHA